jgi:hypothetical protein
MFMKLFEYNKTLQMHASLVEDRHPMKNETGRYTIMVKWEFTIEDTSAPVSKELS